MMYNSFYPPSYPRYYPPPYYPPSSAVPPAYSARKEPKPPPRPQKPHQEPVEETRSKDRNEAPIFEIMGIKLYFDDILIVCLLFFLYQEGVKDQSLYFALVLLLLS